MALLVLNAGSSSLKFALFATQDTRPVRRLSGQASGLDAGMQPVLQWQTPDGQAQSGRLTGTGHVAALEAVLHLLQDEAPEQEILAVGHRVVHGGMHFRAPVRLNAERIEVLRSLVPLVPLHMPPALAVIDAVFQRLPDVTQVACFDTAFHHGMLPAEQRFAIPRRWFDQGVRRYGFHGLSYEYIASVLPEHLGELADGRVIVAHLGHGASLCALRERRSLATTMSFTPLDGIPMATRPGALDPGVVLWWQREAGLTPEEIDRLLEHESGLLGLSGISPDLRDLLASDRPEAAEAVDYYVHHIHRAIASLAAVLGGLDALVFTAGIGEHSAPIRARLCRAAAWLGIELDEAANRAQAVCISTPRSRVRVLRLPTDEESVIARHTHALASADEESA